MDNRLFLTALVVTLSWMSLGSNAQVTTTGAGINGTTGAGNNGTTAAGNNATTAAGNNATTAAANNATTTAGNNATTTTVGNTATTTTVGNTATTTAGNNATTTAGNNATTAAGNNATTAAGNNATTAGNNATTAGNNATTAAGNNATTAGNNATTAGNNATTAAGNNATTAAGNNATTAAGNNATTAAGNNATTGAPPLTPNTTVEILVTPVSRAQCGKQQLCAAAPSQCDPSTAGSCFFLAAKQISGNNFEFGLSGVSNGYIAASLSPGSSLLENATTYVCANNGGVVKFFGTLFSKSQLIVTELNVNSVKGSVNGNKIQCTFAATVPTASTRAVGVALQIATGTFNSTSGTLGAPVAQFRGSVEDLGNPTTNVNNTISLTTASPNTTVPTSSTIPLHRSMTQAMMITVAVLGLAML